MLGSFAQLACWKSSAGQLRTRWYKDKLWLSHDTCKPLEGHRTLNVLAFKYLLHEHVGHIQPTLTN